MGPFQPLHYKPGMNKTVSADLKQLVYSVGVEIQMSNNIAFS
jgi:hypothetical protein